jgi:hypothetical protein
MLHSSYPTGPQVAKHIFQGPTAALERPGYHRGRRGNAALMGMTTMTPRAIGYVAVQVSFILLIYARCLTHTYRHDLQSALWIHGHQSRESSTTMHFSGPL